MNEHKQYVRSKNLETPSGYHFNQPGHDLSHFAGLVLEKVKCSDPFVLRAREFLHIQKFDSYRNGLKVVAVLKPTPSRKFHSGTEMLT